MQENEYNLAKRKIKTRRIGVFEQWTSVFRVGNSTYLPIELYSACIRKTGNVAMQQTPGNTHKKHGKPTEKTPAFRHY